MMMTMFLVVGAVRVVVVVLAVVVATAMALGDQEGVDRLGSLGWESLAPSLHTHLAHRAVAGAFWSSEDVCLHSHKAFPFCEASQVLPLLVTGVGRSGTHHISNVLQLKGLDVCHEHICSDGSVAWTYAAVDPDNKYPWQGTGHEMKHHRFRHVFHLVRHPLRSIASLTTYLDDSWEFIGRHTPEVPGLATMEPILRRALVHWVTWNRMIQIYADQRFRTEDTPPSVICLAAGFNETICDVHSDHHAPRAPREHPTISWSDLAAVDAEFTKAAMILAREYGYEVEPGHDGGPHSNHHHHHDHHQQDPNEHSQSSNSTAKEDG
ncbi:hypothetical protein PTSG_03981 [Salpingoeca rosetta]|uniref:Sulfotransferase domain-containing protein n=1 Tax=Salpingoeca rosetta (strain ATCC 50818 / BSB-021) TaxID=946362 RepID=F2U7F7_SALR5|nr:uncharacterized protein PTSG_03981 [Salpingoeca rosetta]EGD83374.1 hypothetical protein PTSG_03981 [Salpingoeca rosetta]|eukprot:XP_004994878.1 hypothetical protein PTSG_03981 [Salpingoeca rosetta]